MLVLTTWPSCYALALLDALLWTAEDSPGDTRRSLSPTFFQQDGSLVAANNGRRLEP
jgi:hypothetical protein